MKSKIFSPKNFEKIQYYSTIKTLFLFEVYFFNLIKFTNKSKPAQFF